MIYTSYFAKLKSLPSNIIPISICGKAPNWYNGLQYKKLAPKYDFFMQWKENHDNDYYIKCFNEQVLDQLNATDVVLDFSKLSYGYNIGEKDVCLICYEKPSDFCHRHLVAEWLNQNGYKCEEWEETEVEKKKGNNDNDMRKTSNVVKINPLEDGVTHINIYSKSRTALGKFLTNFAYCPIETPEGRFNSIEGYWGYLSISDENPKKEEFHNLYGLAAKRLKEDLYKEGDIGKFYNDFDEKIAHAIHLKFQTPQAKKILKEHENLLDLPIFHYYYYGDINNNPKVIDVTNKYKGFVNSIKHEIDLYKNS